MASSSKKVFVFDCNPPQPHMDYFCNPLIFIIVSWVNFYLELKTGFQIGNQIILRKNHHGSSSILKKGWKRKRRNAKEIETTIIMKNEHYFFWENHFGIKRFIHSVKVRLDWTYVLFYCMRFNFYFSILNKFVSMTKTSL